MIIYAVARSYDELPYEYYLTEEKAYKKSDELNLKFPLNSRVLYGVYEIEVEE